MVLYIDVFTSSTMFYIKGVSFTQQTTALPLLHHIAQDKGEKNFELLFELYNVKVIGKIVKIKPYVN